MCVPLCIECRMALEPEILSYVKLNTYFQVPIFMQLSIYPYIYILFLSMHCVCALIEGEEETSTFKGLILMGFIR